MLRDAAGLAGDDLGLPDRVEERGLAVVDVAHDRDHGRATLEVGFGIVVVRFLGDLFGRADDVDLAVECLGEDLDRLVGERLGQRRHLPELHQLLDHVGRTDAERLGDLAHGRPGGDLEHGLLVLGRRFEGRLFEQRTAPAAAAATRRAARRCLRLVAAGSLRVDDDAATLLAARPAGGSGGLLRGRRGGGCGSLGLRRRLLRRRLRGLGRRRGLRRRRGLGRDALAVRGREHLQGDALLDARGSGLGFNAGGVEGGENLLAGEALRLCDLVNALLRH